MQLNLGRRDAIALAGLPGCPDPVVRLQLPSYCRVGILISALLSFLYVAAAVQGYMGAGGVRSAEG